MFSTGQVVEGAVNYTSSTAVCGEAVTGDNPTIANNQTNLTLPQIQACAQPIGPKWVASITNWLCFLIDGAGLQYASGTVCQNPLLLLDAVIALCQLYGGNIIEGPSYKLPQDGPAAPTPPPNTVGANGQYYQEKETGTVFGPKANGVWPTVPTRYGQGKTIGVDANTQLFFYNAFVEIGPPTGASTWLTTLPTAVDANGYFMYIYNGSTADQTIATAGGTFATSSSEGVTGSETLTLLPGQCVKLVSDDANWVVVNDNFDFLHICNFATALGTSPTNSTYILGCDGSGNLIKFTVAQLCATCNTDYPPTGVGVGTGVGTGTGVTGTGVSGGGGVGGVSGTSTGTGVTGGTGTGE